MTGTVWSFSERMRGSDIQGGSSEWSCCPSASRAETVQASGQAGKRPKGRVRTCWMDNISHLHLKKPQHASMGAGWSLWGEDSLQFYYWNRRPFDPNPVWIWNTWTGKKILFMQFKIPIFPAWNCYVLSLCVCSCGAWLGVYPPLWAADLNTTSESDRPPRQEGVPSSRVSVWH